MITLLVTDLEPHKLLRRHRSYGAHRIIDYTATPLPQAVAGQRFDVVLNLVRTSPDETARLAGLAADGGAFVSTTFPDLDDAGRGANGQGLRAQRWLPARQAGRPR